MAGEIQTSFSHGATLVFLIWNNKTGQVYNSSSGLFEAYATANYTLYAISMTELGTASHHYNGNFPSGIAAGFYGIEARQQIGGAVAETDPTVGEQNFDWGGASPLGLADLVTSGFIGGFFPMRLARGVAVSNFPIYLKSNADHVTPLTSGVLSGQISRDGGAFGALQSGAFAEIGLGFYRLSALTSGDLLANSVALVFTGVSTNGGVSDPLPLSFVMQRTSGQ